MDKKEHILLKKSKIKKETSVNMVATKVVVNP